MGPAAGHTQTRLAKYAGTVPGQSSGQASMQASCYILHACTLSGLRSWGCSCLAACSLVMHDHAMDVSLSSRRAGTSTSTSADSPIGSHVTAPRSQPAGHPHTSSSNLWAVSQKTRRCFDDLSVSLVATRLRFSIAATIGGSRLPSRQRFTWSDLEAN